MGITVLDPGLLTTVQDGGRFGYQQFGVTTSGPMDERAFALANILTGSPEGAEELEMTLSGGRYAFDSDAVIALTGADMKPLLNGAELPMYRAVSVKAGDGLALGFASSGCRTYLSVAGGMKIPLVMGSASTLAGKRLGGIEGRKLQKGDRIEFSAAVSELSGQERRALPQESYPSDEITLRVVAGPQDDCFSREEFRRFFWYGAVISDESDRQGCRLKLERPIKHKGDGNIISDGIAFGSIQIPPNGQPIIMMADRQTVGGYPKIGTVISVDLPKLAQARPGMRVRFIEVGIDLAQELYLKERRARIEIEESFKARKE
ncbi:MAG: biotin-dependent carboxyltransferase family protein [Firmicutes bacterium]|nr:biotin-dependent carboxyltransferase family protein [Bacillota bacterium]